MASALVVCRITAPSPADAIRKLIDLVPEAEQRAARARLAQSLSGIVCVAGLPNASGTGMVVASEVLGWRQEASEAILNPEKTGSIVHEIVRVNGPVETMASSVHNLRAKGLISEEMAERCERVGCDV
jgi:Tfp pilus assembly pilus retraction ATPase PilT